jgi:hypothetical protein
VDQVRIGFPTLKKVLNVLSFLLTTRYTLANFKFSMYCEKGLFPTLGDPAVTKRTLEAGMESSGDVTVSMAARRAMASIFNKN